jgi:hypothetical protein
VFIHYVRTTTILFLALSGALAFAQLSREYIGLHPPPAWSSVEQMHAVYVEKFIQSSGFGAGRMGPVDLRTFSELVLNGQPYTVKKVELIGLIKHPEPTAYVIGMPPQKAFFTNDAARHIQTRALTTFETDALIKLRNGRNEIVGTHDGSQAILGAVRAQKKCLKCHEGKTGNLLGAFSYSMALASKPQAPVLTNNPAPTNLAPQFTARLSSAATER